MQPYFYQSIQLLDGGEVKTICHERPFEASDDESAIVTGEALHEVLQAAEHCNAIRVLDANRAVLWTRLLQEELIPT